LAAGEQQKIHYRSRTMEYYELDKNEGKLPKEFEAGAFRSAKNARSERVRYKQYARHTLSKARNINIRLSERDLQKIKALATQRGLPYQTFISSLLDQHSYSER